MVHDKTTYEWHTDNRQVHTSDIRVTYEWHTSTYEYIQVTYEWHSSTYDYIRVTNGWHTSKSEWHTDHIQVHTSDIQMECEWHANDIKNFRPYKRCGAFRL